MRIEVIYMSEKKTVYKSAKTGKFVTKKYAETHKATTFRETVKKG
jgi:hypothetical protein